ncbi:MAG: MarR family transcriptional regulator [Caldilineaceae bacterium]
MTEPIQFSHTMRQWMDVLMHRSMRGWMQYVKASGLSMPQFGILMRLHRGGECGISDLSEHMETTVAAASQLVEKLVQAELLERTEDPTDRRAKRVALSPAGQAFIQQGIRERYDWVDQLADTLNPEEKERITAALEIMIERERNLESA